MALQNFVDKVGPIVSATWLNVVDVLKFTVFADASTKAEARTALGVVAVYSAVKPSDTQRTNNTFADDPHLVITGVPAGTWNVKIIIFPVCQAANTQGLQDRVTVSSGSYGPKTTFGFANSVQFQARYTSMNTSFQANDITTGVTFDYITHDGVITTNAAATVAYQWSQRATNASYTAIQQGSFMILTQLA